VNTEADPRPSAVRIMHHQGHALVLADQGEAVRRKRGVRAFPETIAVRIKPRA
jgi:hypothetical protein